MGRDSSTPRGFKTAIANARLTPPSHIFISTPDSLTRTGTQDIFITRGSIGSQKTRNAHPFKTCINQFSPKHGNPTPIFSKAIGGKTVPNETADVYASKRMNFMSNSDVAKIPSFMDFRLSPASTPDKLKSIIGPTMRVGGLNNGSNWLASRHDIEEVTVERVREEKANSNYIFENVFETIKVLEQGNISLTQPTFPISPL